MPLFVELIILFDEPLSSQLGPSIESMADARIDGRAGQVTVSQNSLTRPIDYAQNMTASLWGVRRVTEVMQRFGHAVGFAAETSQPAAPRNRVTLALSKQDALNRPAACLTTTHDLNDLGWLHKLHQLAHRIAKECEGQLVQQNSAFDFPPGGGKLVGSCRISAEPEARGG